MTNKQNVLTLVARLVHIRQAAEKIIEQTGQVRQLFINNGEPGTKPLEDFLKAEADAARLITANVDLILGKDAETTPGEKVKTDPDNVSELDSIMGAPNQNEAPKPLHIHPGRRDWFDA